MENKIISNEGNVSNRQMILGSVVEATEIQESHKFKNEVLSSNGRTVIHTLSSAMSFPSTNIDISWLPMAALTYHISPDIRDYVLADTGIVTVDFPNRNLQAFPFEEISFFDPNKGMPVYKTFIGKPTYAEHKNDNPVEAKGVHLDSIMQKMIIKSAFGEREIWKIRTLTAWDRTKDTKLAKDILAKIRNSFSMGAWVNAFICSVCKSVEPCHCSRMGKGTVINGVLQYSMCAGVDYFEQSNVTEPADVTAWTDKIWGVA